MAEMEAVLEQLDEAEREALVSKQRALEASLPEPRSPQDGSLFVYELVDRQGRLTDAGVEVARLLDQAGAYEDLAAQHPPPAADNLFRADLVREVRELARKAGGMAALRRL